MTTRSSAARRRVAAPRVPAVPATSESVWERLAIPAVIVIAVLAMLAIPLWGYLQRTVIPGREPLAIVRGHTITMDDLVRRLRYERALLDLRQARPEEFASVPMQAVFDLVDLELIRQAVANAGLEVTANDIADAKVAIARNGLSGEAWSDIAKSNATRRVWERYLWQQIPPRADQVKIQGFTTYTEREADEVLARLRAGEPMDKLAAELSSTQRYKDSRGEIGWTPRGLRDEAFDNAVFAATPGSLVGPIDTREGFFIVKVLDAAQDKLIESGPFKELQSTAVRRWLDQERKRDAGAVQLFWDSDKYAWANDQVRK